MHYTNQPRTIAEAARELNLSAHTIRAWITQRRVSFVRLGRSIRIPEEEIARLLSRGKVPALDERVESPTVIQQRRNVHDKC